VPEQTDRVAAWRKAQGAEFADYMDRPVEMGPYLSDRWQRDPKTVLFTLARYKFVAKMLAGTKQVAEVGACDGWASRIVAMEVATLEPFDLAPLGHFVAQHDIMARPLPLRAGKYVDYDAVFSLDTIEHVADVNMFMRNIADSLVSHGKAIIGTPSIESQAYASEPSRKLHINCMSGEALRKLAAQHFHHVFMFSMNDEVVHTGFMPMAHYLFAVCAEPIR